MNYVEERLASFHSFAHNLYREYSDIYKEKEHLYLKGTRLLRIRVLNNLVEMMNRQLRDEMEFLLEECRRDAPEAYPELRVQILAKYQHFVSSFRGLGTEAESSNPIN
jgi:hypothetical protein